MAVPAVAGPIRLTVELDREEDGRWIAEIPQIAGVIVYGDSEEAAIASAKGLALNVIGERLRRGEDPLTGIRSDTSVVGFKGVEFEAALAV
jgi:predicted RNase H-like HicB family nuclease